MQSSGLRQLLRKYIDHSISEEEFYRLWETLSQSKYDADWHNAIEQAFSDPSLHALADTEDAAFRLRQIYSLVNSVPENTLQHFGEDDIPGPVPATGRMASPIIIKRVFRYAAILILLLIPSLYFLNKKSPGEVAHNSINQPVPTDSIKPGTQKALLTLGDGTVILLDNAANGVIAEQGKVKVEKMSNGQVRYLPNGTTAKGEKILYNKMSTPRGGQYQLVLPDGSLIWLNAESSITYPAVFAADERRVTITGEVYFEVAKDKTKPFRVVAGDQEVEVLGTHFNINAYADEEHVKTSLLEGSVKVNRHMLRPGEAFMNGKVGGTDIVQDVAWKNGVFNFNNQSLTQVMRQLARWYNLEVVYPAGIPKKEYGGEIGRNLTMDQVLKGLESSGIHLQLEGRRLMVKL